MEDCPEKETDAETTDEEEDDNFEFFTDLIYVGTLIKLSGFNIYYLLQDFHVITVHSLSY